MDIVLKYFSEFTDEQLKQFAALEALYKEWNAKINVISRKDIDSLYEKHVLHSLSIAAVFHFNDGSQVADLGSGGGFPGVPLAIFFPKVQFHLVDSIAKKLKVVEEVSRAAGIHNITTQHSRFEDIKNRQFDFVVSRAVAPLRDLWKWSKPLIKKAKTNLPEKKLEANYLPGLICLKGGDLAAEIQESDTRPNILPIKGIFDELFFDEKYLLYVKK